MAAIVDRWLQWLNSVTLSSIMVWLIWASVATHIHGGTVGRGSFCGREIRQGSCNYRMA